MHKPVFFWFHPKIGQSRYLAGFSSPPAELFQEPRHHARARDATAIEAASLSRPALARHSSLCARMSASSARRMAATCFRPSICASKGISSLGTASMHTTARSARSVCTLRCSIFPDLAALGRAQDPRPVEVGYREGGGHGCSASLAKEGRSQHRGSRVNRSLMPARRLRAGPSFAVIIFGVVVSDAAAPQVRRRSRTRSPAGSSVTCTAATCSCARQPVGALDHVDGRNADNSGGIGRHSRQNA